MLEQGNRSNIFYLEVQLEAVFSKIIANKKGFIFWQGNCKINVLHPSLLKSFALSICSRDSMKKSTMEHFCKSIYDHDGLKMITVFYFSSWNFSSPHYVTMFCLPKPSIIYGESWKINWKNMHFYGLKKILLFLMAGKLK